jgi:hypothetical protein
MHVTSQLLHKALFFVILYGYTYRSSTFVFIVISKKIAFSLLTYFVVQIDLKQSVIIA